MQIGPIVSDDLSSHAKRRSSQRAIAPAWIQRVLEFGVPRQVGNGCTSYALDKKGWRRFSAYYGHSARHFDRLRNLYVIEASDGTIVTAAWRH
jgi:hypothetical protein